jgi:hypothetical protein
MRPEGFAARSAHDMLAAMKRPGAAIVGAAAIAAAGLAARAAETPQPAPPDPPPPASLEIRDVEAWASAYLHRDDWTLITHDTEGARFAMPEGATLAPGGVIEADIRTELFRPIKMEAGWARSGLAHWSVDCAGARYAVLSMTIYSHNNLQGELARKSGADRNWMTPNESQQATISVICHAARQGLPQAPQAAAPAAPF